MLPFLFFGNKAMKVQRLGMIFLPLGTARYKERMAWLRQEVHTVKEKCSVLP